LQPNQLRLSYYDNATFDRLLATNPGDDLPAAQDISAPIDIKTDENWLPFPFSWYGQDLGSNGPSAVVGGDNFTIRHEGDISFTNSTDAVEFFAQADDRIRIWLDGKAILDNWNGTDQETLMVVIPPQASGLHHLVVDYREGGGNASYRFGWRPVNVEAFHGFSFNDPNFGTIGKATDYNFTYLVDDSLEVRLDNAPLFNVPSAISSARTQSLPISGGWHSIQIKFRDTLLNARLLFYWEKAQSLQPNQLRFSYYDNSTFDRLLATNPGDAPPASQSTEVVSVGTIKINDWLSFTGVERNFGGNAPNAVVGGDNFSIRHEGDIRFEDNSNAIQFYAYADNRIRIWLDGKVILDNWDGTLDHRNLMVVIPPQTPDLHHLVVDYREINGNASYRFGWRPVTVSMFHGFDFNDTEYGELKYNGNLGNPAEMTGPNGLDLTWDPYHSPVTSNKDFSAIWSGAFYFTAGNYDFTYLVDDTLDVRLDNTPLFNVPGAMSSERTHSQFIAEGWHFIQLKFRDTWRDARLKFIWVRSR